MDKNLIGCLAEYKFAVMAMENNIRVCFPLLDASPYDCIIETVNGFKKIQIKSVLSDKENVRCYLTQGNTKSYSIDDVDFFAVWIQSHNGFYIFKNTGDIKTITVNKNKKYSKNFNNFAFI